MKRLLVLLISLSSLGFALDTCPTRADYGPHGNQTLAALGVGANSCIYISPSSGSDVTGDGSKANPLQHLRGSRTCVSNCIATPAAGQAFIVKGGESLVEADLPIIFTWAGSAGSPIAITGDQTWSASVAATGNVTTVGKTVTRVDGYGFMNAWAGTTITINGSNYTIDTVQSQTQLTTLTSVGTNSSPVSFSHTGVVRPISDCGQSATCATTQGNHPQFYLAGTYVYVDGFEIINQYLSNDYGADVFTVFLTRAGDGAFNNFIHKWFRVPAVITATFCAVDSSNVVTITTLSTRNVPAAKNVSFSGFTGSCSFLNSATKYPVLASGLSTTQFSINYTPGHASLGTTATVGSATIDATRDIMGISTYTGGGGIYTYCDNNLIDGWDSSLNEGMAVFHCGEANNNTIRYVYNTINGQFDNIKDNLMEHVDFFATSGNHCDYIYHKGPMTPGNRTIVISGNVFGNSAAVGCVNFINALTTCPTCNTYLHDNIWYGLNSGSPTIAISGNNTQGGIFWVYNNTIVSFGSQSCLGDGLTTPEGVVAHYANNHCITTNVSGSAICQTGGSITCTDDGGNLLQTPTVANLNTTPTFNQYNALTSYVYSPQATTNSTVAAGITQSQLNSLGYGVSTSTTYFDTSYGGVLRSQFARPTATAWDAGAFEWANVVPPLTLTGACAGNSNGTVATTQVGHTLSITCTAGVATGTTTEAHAIGDTVTIAATASTGQFVGFTGGGLSTSPGTIASLNDDTTVTATFSLTPTVNLSCVTSCNIQFGKAVTLSSTVGNIENPAQPGDGWQLLDPVDTVVASCSGNSCNGTFNGGSTPSLTFTPSNVGSGQYTIIVTNGALQSQATVNINVGFSMGGIPAGAVGH
jgi:hypothetical protein